MYREAVLNLYFHSILVVSSYFILKRPFPKDITGTNEIATFKLLHFVAQHTVSFFSQKAVSALSGSLQSRILPWFSFLIWPKRKKMPQTAAFFAHSFFTESKPIGLHNAIFYTM
jgi:hypothetical protein